MMNSLIFMHVVLCNVKRIVACVIFCLRTAVSNFYTQSVTILKIAVAISSANQSYKKHSFRTEIAQCCLYYLEMSLRSKAAKS